MSAMMEEMNVMSHASFGHLSVICSLSTQECSTYVCYRYRRQREWISNNVPYKTRLVKEHHFAVLFPFSPQLIPRPKFLLPALASRLFILSVDSQLLYDGVDELPTQASATAPQMLSPLVDWISENIAERSGEVGKVISPSKF